MSGKCLDILSISRVSLNGAIDFSDFDAQLDVWKDDLEISLYIEMPVARVYTVLLLLLYSNMEIVTVKGTIQDFRRMWKYIRERLSCISISLFWYC